MADLCPNDTTRMVAILELIEGDGRRLAATARALAVDLRDEDVTGVLVSMPRLDDAVGALPRSLQLLEDEIDRLAALLRDGRRADG